ncbi:hypothetical protein GA0115242_13264 [Streptomyces sp. SolWspMP-5a-2]|nr:hypothetical protein GA0115242_13264 [Streptomyces sp. SolWspMP-5a-2]
MHGAVWGGMRGADGSAARQGPGRAAGVGPGRVWKGPAAPPRPGPVLRCVRQRWLNHAMEARARSSKPNRAWFSQPLPEDGSAGSQPLPVTAVQVASQ